MYYVFNTDITSWHKTTVQAWPTQDIPYQEITPHWWMAKPLEKPLPVLSFLIQPNAPKPDNFFTGTTLDLYSARLIEIISSFGIKFESFEVKILDESTREVLPFKYELFHLLETKPAIDIAQSDLEFERGTISGIRRIVLTEDQHPLFFRLTQKKNLVLIHETVKVAFDKAKITGCRYLPVNQYSAI